ncbi:AzlC family ABC transporter permease (plasmid) [Vibrio europaeus]|uniref:AzlC family ABC transporter permease n=1 Tax=Vibrio europaeus TaxID=300876 RepID=A0AAE7AY12_9VIBR|nr:AzlC family ABC transporter permease [Vibrio europaeus]QJY38015.1 AzlC family ABC transporter permease [Vibrio europaeus]
MSMFKRGCLDATPQLISLLPFAILTGVSAIQAGMTPWTAQLSSVLLMSGASQIAAASLMTTGATPLVVIFTHIAINFRYAIYSAGLAQLKLDVTPAKKVAAAQVLIDQTYALTFLRSQEHMMTPRERTYYYFGTALPMWLTWQCGTAIGILGGSNVPDYWELDFAITLCFISLLVPMVKSHTVVVVTGVSGISAAMTYHWPYNLGFLFSIASGVLAGGGLLKWKSQQAQRETV